MERPHIYSHAQLTTFSRLAIAGEGRDADRKRDALRHALIMDQTRRAVDYYRWQRDHGLINNLRV